MSIDLVDYCADTITGIWGSGSHIFASCSSGLIVHDGSASPNSSTGSNRRRGACCRKCMLLPFGFRPWDQVIHGGYATGACAFSIGSEPVAGLMGL